MLRAAATCFAAVALGLGACESTSSGDDGYTASSSRTNHGFANSIGLEGGYLERAERPAPAPAARPAPVVRTGDCFYSPDAGADSSVVALAFPTGDPATSPLMLHQVMPSQVRRGAEFGYQYHVTNTSNGTLQNVAVVLESQDNLDVLSASPSPSTGAGGSTWIIGDLGPCETRVINLRARANNVGMAANCISATYNNLLCAATEVVDPSISIEKMATPLALRCDMIELTYTVCNTGSGEATGVMFRDQLPAGMTAADGSRTIERMIGTLAAGQCETVTVLAEVSRSGEFMSSATAMAEGDLTATSGSPRTVITQPVLQIVSECRDEQFLGRPATYTFTVSNTGDGVSENTMVQARYPATAEFRSASTGGTPMSGGASWSLGSLAPGESRTVSLELANSSASSLRVDATVNGDCADPAMADCTVLYKGIPAILLEVIDIDDPVEVGTQTTYVITVTNQGSAPDTNIRVVAVLPNSQAYVSDAGATTGRVNGQEIDFAPLPTLAPGARAEFRITIRALEEEDSRLSVEMTSDQFTRPIRETESTNLYR
ncbi:MAG: hypothetical protein AAF235_04085 [Planctomycetota bacterium]